MNKTKMIRCPNCGKRANLKELSESGGVFLCARCGDEIEVHAGEDEKKGLDPFES
jgi:DNA-directed RNA polymerase subunit RPC12/RpoP